MILSAPYTCIISQRGYRHYFFALKDRVYLLNGAKYEAPSACYFVAPVSIGVDLIAFRSTRNTPLYRTPVPMSYLNINMQKLLCVTTIAFSSKKNR